MDIMLNLADKLQVEVDRLRHSFVSVLGRMGCFFVCISRSNAVTLLAVASSEFPGSKMTTRDRMYRW